MLMITALSCKKDVSYPLTGALVSATGNAGTKIAGSSYDYTLLLDFSGEVPLTSVSVSTLSAPFSFKGGSFPGTGGTCSTTISADCTLVLSFSPTDVTTSTASSTVSYTSANGSGSLSVSLSGTSVMGSCYDSSNELDDYTSNGDSECDSGWVNTAVIGGNVSVDQRTGLMWSRSSEPGDITSEVDGVNNGMINWFEATGTTASGGACTNADHSNCNPDGESFCALLNSSSYGGYSNWRAPGQKELMQAYVDGGSHTADVFDVAKYYWANTTESDDAIWGAYFNFGWADNADDRKNTANYYGICVRSATTATFSALASCKASSNEVDDFLAAGDNECDSSWTNQTVTGGDVSTDTRTGLMWSRDSEVGDIASETDGLNDGWINWFEATGTAAAGGACTNADHSNCNADGESYCGHLNSISYGSYTDWRSPGQKELMQAYINGGSQSATVFDSSEYYWANTTESTDPIWGIYRRFGYGNGSNIRKNSQLKAICVRYTH